MVVREALRPRCGSPAHKPILKVTTQVNSRDNLNYTEHFAMTAPEHSKIVS